MGNPTDKQLSYILQLANELTGERARYASQSSIDLRVRSGAEASGLIGQLQDAIKAEQQRQQRTGIVVGAKIRCTFQRKDGTQGQLAGTVSGYHWSGTEVNGIYLDGVTASWEVKGSWFYLDRMTAVSTGEDPEALHAERERLLARVAEIDAILAGK